MENEGRIEKIEQHQRKLSVPLSDAERIQKGRELAQAHQELESHEVSANEAKASLKAQKTAIESRIQALAAAIRAGSETRDVWCYGVADITNRRIRYFREDTDEYVGDRAIKDDERQLSVPGTEAAVLPFKSPDITAGPAETVADEEHEPPSNVRARCGHVTAFTGDPTPERCSACAHIHQDQPPPKTLEVIDATEQGSDDADPPDAG